MLQHYVDHPPVIHAVIDDEDIAFAALVRWAGKSMVLMAGRGALGLAGHAQWT